jgi:hypothetical protein
MANSQRHRSEGRGENPRPFFVLTQNQVSIDPAPFLYYNTIQHFKNKVFLNN